jgi:Raf kinase inhibitor-like YbhB/YbcL family protein
MSITIRSTAFHEGDAIPVPHTADGEDRSPPLTWTTPPKGTKELALIVDDPDAPTPEPWVHWIVTRIPGAANGLPGGFHEATTPEGAPSGLVQGVNSWGTTGYRGPEPPKGHGVHHYHFKLYALDGPLDLPAGVDKATLLEAMSGRILARNELVGTYER